jgi:hypothetical protein
MMIIIINTVRTPKNLNPVVALNMNNIHAGF